MAIRHDRLITAALVLAAVTATACSEGKPAAKKTVESKQAVGTTLVAESGHAGETPALAVAGPVSFADGEAAYNAKNYTEAATVFTRFTEKRPDNAWGHFMLGLSSWKSGDLAKAEEAFDAALRIDPDHMKSLVNSSRVLLEQKRPADAVERLTRASELDPSSSDVHRLLGRAYQAQGKTEEAVTAYRHAIEVDAEDSWAMNNLGLLFLQEGRAADAVPLLTRAVELRSDIPAFHNNLGMALEHTGKFTAAATAYSGALTADPDYAKARQNLARVEKVKEDPKEVPDVEAAAKPVTSEAAAESLSTSTAK
jgi:Flp pilus assembly protein TadD